MDIRTVSRTAAVVTLSIGGVAGAVPLVVTANDDAPAAGQFPDHVAHFAVAAGANAMVLALVCLVTAMIYAARLARRGTPNLAFLGGGLSALAWLAGLISLGGVQLALYQGPRLPDRAGAAVLVDAVNADPIFNVLVLTFVLGHIVGVTILGIALWRSRAVWSWVELHIRYLVRHTVDHTVSPAVDVASGFVIVIGSFAVAARIAPGPNDACDLPAGVVVATPQPVAVAA